MSQSPYISDVDTASFAEMVLEKSQQLPVLVDFWADWCNPCKMLTPIISKVVDEFEGKVLLAKINSDQERALADRYGIRSLPTVKIFKFGEVVDEFSGVTSEGMLVEIINKHIVTEFDIKSREAFDHLQQGNLEQAQQILEALNAEDKQNKKVITVLGKLYLHQGQTAQAEKLLQYASISDIDDEGLAELRAQLNFAQSVPEDSDESSLRAAIQDNEKDPQAHYQLGALKALQGDYETALESFLTCMKLDRGFNEDAGRKAILAVFDLLGNGGPLVTRYRGKMAMLLH